MRRRAPIVGLVLVALAVAGYVGYRRWAPTATWRDRPILALRVAVVDYTVPFTNFREHAGVMWVLDHQRVATPDGAPRWDPARHYVGYQPTARATPRRLETLASARLDLIYVADTYGVNKVEPASNFKVTAKVYSESCSNLSTDGSNLFCVNSNDSSLYKITLPGMTATLVLADSGMINAWDGADRYEVYGVTAIRKVATGNVVTPLAGIARGHDGIGSDTDITFGQMVTAGEYLYAIEPSNYTVRRAKIASATSAIDKPSVETWAGCGRRCWSTAPCRTTSPTPPRSR